MTCLKMEASGWLFLFFLIERKSFSNVGNTLILSRYRTNGVSPALLVSLSVVISTLSILRLAKFWDSAILDMKYLSLIG